jgi:hypothetical protein
MAAESASKGSPAATQTESRAGVCGWGELSKSFLMKADSPSEGNPAATRTESRAVACGEGKK